MNHLCVLLFLSIFFYSCSCEGDLGNNLSLLEGDNEKDRVIVFCSDGGLSCCSSGIFVIPTYQKHMKDGKYSEFVDSAISNDKWIIVKTIQVHENDPHYYLLDKQFELDITNCRTLNCDSVLQDQIRGPFGFEEFLMQKRNLGINLRF